MISRNCFTRSIFLILVILSSGIKAQNVSTAKMWNEAILEAIRNDYARPTVHARNLFHFSIALYDSWALFNPTAETYLLGKSHGSFTSDFNPSKINLPTLEQQLEEVASYAVYRLLSYRFSKSPGRLDSQHYFDSLMISKGYPTNLISVNYEDGTASSLGNYIATEIIRYGLQDGSNEQNDYGNDYYLPVNAPLLLTSSGNPNLTNPNRWQPLAFNLFIDQSGNPLPESIPSFLSPEWGNVLGFSLDDSNLTTYTRDGFTYKVYHDIESPPYLAEGDPSSTNYQWGFSLVSEWASHLDPNDGVLWDISPASIGNINNFPNSIEEYPAFYQQQGGDWGTGHPVNPSTGLPYEPIIVPRGDYARVLAEFWADGPDSETPPGHWFTILNHVMEHPLFERKYKGQTLLQSDFEYDVKAYFMLGAAMHDAAITSWSIKGWYDYIRPISAIRYMAQLGQSTDKSLSNYHPLGIPLKNGYIEVVQSNDPLVVNPEDVGKIKLFTWKGPDYILNPDTDMAGVGWILAENWWPYQRPTFVTPPFAGYISGHSTYSSAAARILTLLTGDPFFPGGMANFIAKKNQFLVFEEGPSVDVPLEWATYRDASDQCSLSRIWGGIHPPADDIPGRKLGIIIGEDVFKKVESYFSGVILSNSPELKPDEIIIYPNPVNRGQLLTINTKGNSIIELWDIFGKLIHTDLCKGEFFINTDELNSGIYLLRIQQNKKLTTQRIIIR